MGIFPDDLKQVYDNVAEHKLRQTELEEATPKLVKDLNNAKRYFSHSLSVLE